MDIRSLHQKDTSVQEFYFAKINLWDHLVLTESEELRAFPAYIARRKVQHLVRFLMALRDDFEALRGNIVHRNPLPSVDSTVSELPAEKIRHKCGFMKGLLPSPTQNVLVVPSRPQAKPQNKSSKPTASNECNFCHQTGHWKAQCPQILNKATSHPPSYPQPLSHSLHVLLCNLICLIQLLLSLQQTITFWRLIVFFLYDWYSP
ncbi:GRF zinc finger / Zinc knuckle protein [Perilla frutescens var. frutescens]|nr:GRF zinc finger / Zinc knuckle protein [Perilla frutescens var. frutescens]